MNSSEVEVKDQIKFITVRYETPLGGANFDIRPFSRAQFEKLGKRHRKPVVSKKNRSVTDYELNLETYYPDLYSRLVKGWSGLTGDVKKLLLHENLDEENPDKTEVEFSIELLVKMCRTSNQFADFIDNAAMNFDDLYAEDIRIKREKFEQERLDIETKN